MEFFLCCGSPFSGSITIDSEKIEVVIQSPVIEAHLNHAVGPWPVLSKKDSDGNQLSESATPSSTISTETIEDASKFMRIRIVGSVAINFISFVGYAHLDVSFDAGSGNISFVASQINHPPFMFHGVTFIFVCISSPHIFCSDLVLQILSFIYPFSLTSCSCPFHNRVWIYDIVQEDISCENESEG